MESVPESKDFSFPDEELKILEFWEKIDAFQQQLERRKGSPSYVFYDGPPFATGLPHYGHLLAGSIKDIVTRYAAATGHYCPRRFGWDCHGLPVEHEIDKLLNVKARQDVFDMGIDVYNEECRKIVMRYSQEWERTVKRIGRWIDFDTGYRTMDASFMESVWWVFKQLWDKGLVYRGYKVMPYSTGCKTPLSNFEAGENRKDASDPAIQVAFKLDHDEDGAELVAWTTTPWTLPSNLALCVNPGFDYVKVKDPASGRVYIVAQCRLGELPGAVPKEGKKGKEATPGFQVLARMKGEELRGRTYQPLFPYFAHLKQAPPAQNGHANGCPQSGPFRILVDEYVTDASGTGVVHQAPAFGEDDMRVCLAQGILAPGDDIPCPVDADGNYTQEVPDFAGRHVKDADADIIQLLKARGVLVANARIVHNVPFCPRSETPLIYKAVPSWFVKVEGARDRVVRATQQTHWVPAYVKDKRFQNWLENARDWAVSRSRFWGTPLPIWSSEDGSELRVVGSVQELEELTGHKATDLHRHFIDHLTIPSQRGGPPLKRIDEVFDCWFESGSMPYAQLHYPFENRAFFEANFPADFVAEGLDQTRGWFYTLMVLSTLLFDRPAFKHLVCNGLVLAADGKKMSKRLKNYPDPGLILKEYGADALRLYLINSPVVRAESLRFRQEGVLAVVKDVFLPWYNAYRFLVQNVARMESASQQRFRPAEEGSSGSSNVMDQWIQASTRTLAAFVRQEMEEYRLYTVVPRLLAFVEALTNVYVRYNRDRLKGRGGAEDCLTALQTLFGVLLQTCEVMAPFTPFICEHMYQNLRKALPQSSPESVHWRDFPAAAASQEGDAELEASVGAMQQVIELSRTLRERRAKPLKQPLAKLIVIHPDRGLLADLEGRLRSYIISEVNVVQLETCSDTERYSNVQAQPDFKVLGKRLGKAMKPVGEAIKALTREQIAEFERSGLLTVQGHELEEGDLKVVREFRLPEGVSAEDMDSNGDGDLLVALDLRSDDSLALGRVARELVNRVQKLRKALGLSVADFVEVWLVAQGDGFQVLQQALSKQREAISMPLGALPRLVEHVPSHLVVRGRDEARLTGDIACSFTAVITAPSLHLHAPALLQLTEGDRARAASLQAYLASRAPQQLSPQHSCLLDGVQYSLYRDQHYSLPGGQVTAAEADDARTKDA